MTFARSIKFNLSSLLKVSSKTCTCSHNLMQVIWYFPAELRSIGVSEYETLNDLIGKQNIILLYVKPLMHAVWRTVSHAHVSKISVLRVWRIQYEPISARSYIHSSGVHQVFAKPHVRAV